MSDTTSGAARRRCSSALCGFYVPVGRVGGICETYDDSGDLDHESPCMAVIARECDWTESRSHLLLVPPTTPQVSSIVSQFPMRALPRYAMQAAQN